MVLERLYPFNELRSMDETVNRVWRRFNGRFVADEQERWAVPLDVVQNEEDIVVRATLPGVKPDDIEVTTDNDVLTIRGQSTQENEIKEGSYLMRERRTGSFHRTLRLPDSVDLDKVDSRYEHGVLTITFPKLEAKKAKRLDVKVA